jgi:hypothetical protein
MISIACASVTPVLLIQLWTTCWTICWTAFSFGYRHACAAAVK